MVGLGKRLRERARQLGLSDAEVARRAGLSERRYGNYVADAREPDFASFLRICAALDVTPNDLLLPPDRSTGRQSARDKLVARLGAAANVLSDANLSVAVEQVAVLARSGSAAAPRGSRR